MKSGFARICIDPPYGAPIIGYYQPRFVKGIADSLYARAAAFDDGGKRAVIIALDLCLLGQKYIPAMLDAVAGAAGIDREAVFITCSHTHTGPVVGKDFASDRRSSEAYDAFLINAVRDAALYALADLRPTRIETADAQAKGISFVRRYRMKDGSVATNPGVNNPDIDCALGEPNETVKLVKLLREGGETVLLVNFGTHPDTVGGEYISADYPGVVCATLERTLPDTKCMFLQGPQGDVNHINVHPTEAQARLHRNGAPEDRQYRVHMGRVIAGAVLSVFSVTEPVGGDSISYASRVIQLPSHQENDRIEEVRPIWELYNAGRRDEIPLRGMAVTTAIAEAKRIIRLEHGPESYPFTLSALRIGDLAFAGFSGEPFTEIRNRIDAGSAFAHTVQCALTNGAVGYIPTRSAYDEGGYEAKASVLRPGCDDLVVGGMLALLQSLK